MALKISAQQGDNHLSKEMLLKIFTDYPSDGIIIQTA